MKDHNLMPLFHLMNLECSFVILNIESHKPIVIFSYNVEQKTSHIEWHTFKLETRWLSIDSDSDDEVSAPSRHTWNFVSSTLKLFCGSVAPATRTYFQWKGWWWWEGIRVRFKYIWCYELKVAHSKHIPFIVWILYYVTKRHTEKNCVICIHKWCVHVIQPTTRKIFNVSRFRTDFTRTWMDSHIVSIYFFLFVYIQK